jgi:hypothetical protein
MMVEKKEDENTIDLIGQDDQCDKARWINKFNISDGLWTDMICWRNKRLRFNKLDVWWTMD